MRQDITLVEVTSTYPDFRHVPEVHDLGFSPRSQPLLLRRHVARKERVHLEGGHTGRSAGLDTDSHGRWPDTSGVRKRRGNGLFAPHSHPSVNRNGVSSQSRERGHCLTLTTLTASSCCPSSRAIVSGRSRAACFGITLDGAARGGSYCQSYIQIVKAGGQANIQSRKAAKTAQQSPLPIENQ